MRETKEKARWWKGAWYGSVVVGVAVGAVAGIFLPDQKPNSELAQGAQRLSAGNMDSPFDLKVEPIRISSRSGESEEMELAVRLNSRFTKTASFLVAHHFAEVRGDGVSRTEQLPPVQVHAGETMSQSIFTPRSLGNGNYILRVTAAGTDGANEGVVETEKYFRIEDSEIIPLDANEWFQISEVMEAHIQE